MTADRGLRYLEGILKRLIAAMLGLALAGPASSCVLEKAGIKGFCQNSSVASRLLGLVWPDSRPYQIAVVAGIAHYPNLPADQQLPPVDYDVDGLTRLLLKKFGFDEVVVLKDRAFSLDNLKYVFAQYIPTQLVAHPKSQVLFAYSGHGADYLNTGYLFFSDTHTIDPRSYNDLDNAIDLDELKVLLKPTVFQATHFLALLNSCKGGYFLQRGSYSFGATVLDARGAHGITAGGAKDNVHALKTVGSGNGSVFFEMLFSALGGSGANLNGAPFPDPAADDGILTTIKLNDFLYSTIEKIENYKFGPQMGRLFDQNDGEGYFFFITNEGKASQALHTRYLKNWDRVFGSASQEGFGSSSREPAPGTRLALVIGNDAYAPQIGKLNNPQNDIALVGSALKQIGFDVVSEANLSRADTMQEVHNYALRLSKAGPGAIGFFYFSGHGLSNSADHSNYLIPIDVSTLQDQRIWSNAVALDEVLSELQKTAPNASNIVVLDACRDQLRLPTGSVAKGFEPVTNTRGMYIAFSTSPNGASSDAGDGGGAYARILASEIVRPGQDEVSLFHNVQERVYEATHQTQRPWENSDLIGHIYLAGAPPPKAQPGLEDQAKLIWEAFGQQSSDVSFLEHFIALYGEIAPYGALARQRLAEVDHRVPPKAAPVSPPEALSTLKHDVLAACRPKTAHMADNVTSEFNRVTLKPILATAKEVRTIAISPDGKQIATAGDDRIIRLWDVASLKLMRELRGHSAPVYGLAFSIDGALLASASLDGTVRIWSARTFALVRTFSGNNGTTSVLQYDVAFEPVANPRYVDSAGADGNVWIWDMTTGNLAMRKATGGSDVRSLSFAPGASGTFATGSFDGKVRFFGGSGKVTTVPGGSGKTLHVAYSPDGKLVASAGVDSANNDVKLWNASNYELFKPFQAHRGHATSVGWSHDSTHLATGGGYLDPSVRLWEVQSGKQLQLFSGHSGDVEAVAFHPNQKWIVSASEDKTVRIWDIASANELLSLVGFPEGEYLAFAPNGCYTGSANAANYVKYVTKDTQGHEHDTGDNGKNTLFVPANSADMLLPK